MLPLYYPRCSLKELLKENKFDYIFVAGNEHFANTEHNGNKYPIIHTITIKKGSYNIFKSDGFYIFDRKNKKKDGFPSETAFMNNFLQTYYIPQFTKDLLTGERDLTVLSRGETGDGGGSLSRLYFKFTNNYAESKIGSRDLDELFSKVKAKKNNFYVLATNIPELMDLQDKDIQKYVPVKPIPIKPIPSGGDGDGNSDGGGKNNDLTKINEKIAKLDNLDKLSFLEQIYKKCCEIKDKISNLDILKDILDYLKKILYENQKTNDYFSTLMKSLDFDKHKVDNSNFKELLKFLQKFREDLFQDMANLDRDGDHPDLSAIYDINSNILSKLNDFMPSGILPKILNAIESLNGNVGGNLGRLNDSLSFIVRVIGGGGSGGSVTGGGGSGDTSNNFISSVTNITNNIKNLAGSEEQAKKDLDDLKHNMQKFVNQEPFGSGREAEEQLKKFKVAKPGKSIPVYKIEAFKGIQIPAMDFGPFLGIIADIRKILVAMLWISLFLYLVRVFIPKLKV